MIAGCPKCSARYRVDLGQIGEDGAKLRCTKCSAVFLVRAPQPTPPAAAPEVVPEPVPNRPEPIPAAAAEETPVSPLSEPEPDPEPDAHIDPTTLVLIADSSEERGKRVASAVESWGLSPILVHDGVEAMMAIQRKMPQVVILDAALPKMFGFQVCEIVKRNESLRYMNVVLVGAIHHQDRYRRNPAELYGADVYLEQPDLPDGLLPLLRDAGMSVRDAGMSVRDAATTNSAAPSAPPVIAEAPTPPTVVEGMEAPAASAPIPAAPVSEPTPTPAATPEPAAAGNSELDAERERAERLARIAVSEMLLYQPEKFDQAIRDGNIEAVLDLEIQEARALIRQRIGEEVRAEKDFILVELERVAQERSTPS